MSSFLHPPTIYYLPTRGDAEYVKLVFEESSERYNFVSVSEDDLKKQPDKFPFLYLPVLEDGTFRLSGTGAITRYVAQLTNLYPDDKRVAAYAEQFFEAALHLQCRFSDFSITHRIDESTFLTTMNKIYTGIEFLLHQTGKILITSNSNYISFADLSVFHITDLIRTCYPTSLDSYPLLRSLHDHVGNSPRIIEYLKSDRCPNPKLILSGSGSGSAIGGGGGSCPCMKGGECTCVDTCDCGSECGCANGTCIGAQAAAASKK